MRCFVFLALLGLIIQPTCGTRYFVKIQPDTGGEVYQMQVGQTATFKLTTFEQAEGGDLPSQVEIEQTFWSYNKRLLEKVYSDNYSLELKAVKAGAATMEVTTFIGSSQNINNLTILVTE